MNKKPVHIIQDIIPKTVIIFLATFLISSANVCQVGAENEKPTSELQPDPQPIALEISEEIDYEYQLENRTDPFMPFLTEKATASVSATDEIVDDDINLSGMRQFEPGQLSLVAILSSNSLKMAMVEDVTGKGYIINEGTPIGRRGVVTEIKEEQVYVTETARTRSGRELVNTIIMRLKKEGE